MSVESTNLDSKQDRLIRSFGRIKSRKLSENKNHLLEKILPEFEIYFPKINSSNHNVLEIGFGFGDFMFAKAKSNPNKNFFGCEPHINGVVNLLSKCQAENVKNVQISRQDVRILLSEFPDDFFSEIYILFPDPWPKSKHFKRRLINAEFLDEILSPKMKSKSALTIATDHASYKTWILAEILKSKKISWLANSKQDWQVFPDDWVETKYQKKAAVEGRISVIFKLEKND